MVVSKKLPYKEALEMYTTELKDDNEQAELNKLRYQATQKDDKRTLATVDFIENKKTIIKLRRDEAKAK
jgi:hypothetical protein